MTLSLLFAAGAGCLAPADDLDQSELALAAAPASWTRGDRTPHLGEPRVQRAQATHVARTEAELRVHLAQGNRIVWVLSDIEVTQTLTLQPGTVLASSRAIDRGGTAPGARLYARNAIKPMIAVPPGSDGVRITGLRIEGPSSSSDGDAPDGIGIRVDSARDVRIDYNEIYNFPISGVDVIDHTGRIDRTGGIAYVTDNFFHHNQRDDLGYGIVSSHGAYARIERNTFNHHRHGVASNGKPGTGYYAYYNLFLSATVGYNWRTYYGQHLDVHGVGSGGHGGTAGELFDIGYNTIAGDQSAFGSDAGTRPAFRIRGAPSMHAAFHHNAVDQDNDEEAVSVNCGIASPCIPIPDVRVFANRFGVTSHEDLAVGDFNGDGRADVFRATGAGWWYSSAGRTEWRFLNPLNLRIRELAFADIDSDGETDVLTRTASDSMIWWSRGGRENMFELTTTAVPLDQLRFGDFTGDGVTDYFRTAGGQWYIWDGATRTESWVGSSSASLSDLAFADVDDVRGTDVLVTQDGEWRYSSGARTRWTRLGRGAVAMRNAVLADFDDDGRVDIAWQDGAPGQPGTSWKFSSGGRGAATTMRTISAADHPLRRMLIGDFDGLGGADALWYERTGVASGPFFGAWLGIGRDGVSRRSLHDMI